MVQILAEEDQLEQLEGIKLAKFLKRATGSRRVGTALLKIGGAAAVAGGGYYANKKYNLTGRLKKIVTPTTQPQKTGTVNTSLLQRVIDSFLTPASTLQTPQTQKTPQQAQIMPLPQKSSINPMMIAALGLLGIGAFMLLKRR